MLAALSLVSLISLISMQGPSQASFASHPSAPPDLPEVVEGKDEDFLIHARSIAARRLLQDTNPATVDEKSLSSARMCQVRPKEFPNLLACINSLCNCCDCYDLP